MSIGMYTSETWLIKADDKRRISAFETKCIGSISGITYIHQISNADLRKRLHRSTQSRTKLDVSNSAGLVISNECHQINSQKSGSKDGYMAHDHVADPVRDVMTASMVGTSPNSCM